MIINKYFQILAALLLLMGSAHATTITWEDRGGEAIRLGAVTSTTSTPSGTYYSVTSNGVIAESHDGGMTWETANLSQSNIRFNSVKFFDDTHGVAVGEGYLAYRNGASIKCDTDEGVWGSFNAFTTSIYPENGTKSHEQKNEK